MIVVTHNGTDITESVDTSGFEISDERNSTRDTLDFSVAYAPGGFRPALNAEIIVTLDGTRIFGGSILKTESVMLAPPTIVYSVSCVDYSYQADRRQITERFIDTSMEDIIAALVDTYADAFTVANVSAPQMVARISFNRLTLSECLDKLARLSNYSWYIDYNKDIHFFARNSEPSPFNLTDTSNNYVVSSLRIKEDLSQLRNVVQVEGGEVPIAARSTLHAGDGERTEFPTHFKFSSLPVVTVNGVTKTVGTEYLETEGFDCYWSFQEKYVRFADTAIPPVPATGTTNIEIIGTPLAPLVAVVPDEESVGQYGEFEYSIVEDTLGSQEQIIERGLAELEAKATEINEASFDTYTPGLRSGQIITIASDARDIDAEYVIQRVNFRPYPNGSAIRGVWSVSLASAATMSLVEALQKLLRGERIEEDDRQVLLSFFRFNDRATGSDSVEEPETTQGPYVWDVANWGFSTWQ